MPRTNITTLRVVFNATNEWLRIAVGEGLAIDWESADDADFVRAARIAGFDPNDSEYGLGVLTSPRECDTVLRAGDLVAVEHNGGRVAFLRRDRCNN